MSIEGFFDRNDLERVVVTEQINSRRHSLNSIIGSFNKKICFYNVQIQKNIKLNNFNEAGKCLIKVAEIKLNVADIHVKFAIKNKRPDCIETAKKIYEKTKTYYSKAKEYCITGKETYLIKICTERISDIQKILDIYKTHEI